MRAIIGILLLCACAWTADSPAQDLFRAAREKVIRNVEKVPRYTCVETIDRVQYRPQYDGRPASCPLLIAARARLSSKGLVTWHDRLRLDVAAGDGSEMFSWAGASKFETNEMDTLTGSGATGSGAFSSFLTSVFGNDPDHYFYAGFENKSAVFEYSVPQHRSHYSYRVNDGTMRVIPYHGKFYIAPANADVERLVVEATQFPVSDVCRVEDTMDYKTVKIGSGDFRLPELSTMTALYKSGDESVNQTRFSGCHEYVGESTIRFDDESDPAPAVTQAKAALKALPPKTHVAVRLETPIDSDSAAAGDAVVGIVDRDGKVIRKNDRLHGRILRLEQYMTPYPRWIVAIRFDSIERDGVRQQVTFNPVDDGDRTPTFGRARRMTLPTEPRGAGIFSFDAAGRLLLDQKFRSVWEVAAN